MILSILFYGFEWENMFLFLAGPLSLFIFIYASFEKINTIKYILNTIGTIFLILFILTAKKPDKVTLTYYKNKTFLLEEIEKEIPTIIKESKKPIIFYFYADWCHSCEELEERLSNQEIGKFIQNDWIVIKIDVTDYEKYEHYLTKTYQVYGVPALAFHDINGNIIKPFTMVGAEIPTQTLVSILRQFSKVKEYK